MFAKEVKSIFVKRKLLCCALHSLNVVALFSSLISITLAANVQHKVGRPTFRLESTLLRMLIQDGVFNHSSNEFTQ